MANEQVNLELVLSANLQNFSSQLDSLANRKIDIPIRFSSDANALSADLAKTRKEAQLVIDGSKALTSNLKGQRDILQSQAFELKQIGLNAKQNLQQSGRTTAFYQQQLKALDGAAAAIKSNRRQYEAVNAKILEAARTASSFKDRLKELGNQAQSSVQQKTEGFFDSLLGKLTLGGVLVEGFKQVLQGLGDFFQRGIDFEQLQLGLQAFTGSVDEADKAYESFKQTALETPFDVAGVAQAGKTLLAFQVDVDTAKDATRRLAIIAGATGSDLNNLARNLGQISAQGRAYARDLNQFATAGIPIYAKLADILGVTVQEVRQFTTEGKIGFDEVESAIKALTATGSAFSNLAAQQLNTVQGQLGNLSTSVTEFSGAFLQAFGPFIVSSLKAVSGAVDGLAANFDTLSSVVIGVFTAAFIGKAVPAVLSFASGVRAIVFLTPTLVAAFQGVAAASTASASSAALYSNVALALSRNLGVLTTVIGAVTKAILVFAAKTVVFAAVAGAVSLLVSTLNSYKPTEALKEDGKRIKEFSKAIDELNAKSNNLAGSAPKLSKAFKDFAKAADLDRAKDGFIVTQLALNKLNANLDKFESNSAKAAAANNKLVKSNAAYLVSSNKSIQSTRDQIALTSARVAALQQENQFLEANAAALEAEAKAADVPAVRAAILEQIALIKARAAANKAIIPDLQRQQAELSKLIGLKNLFEEGLGGNLESAQAFAAGASDQFKALGERIDALGAARLAPLQTATAQLKAQISSITQEYERQNAVLREQKATQDAILAALSAEEELAKAKAVGPEAYKQELEERRRIAELELQGLEQAQRRGALVQEDINRQKELIAVLNTKLNNADKEVAARQRVAEANNAIAQNEAESAQASEGLRAAYADVAVQSETVSDNLKADKAALDEITAKAAALDIGGTVAKSIGDAVEKAGELGAQLDQLNNTTYEVNVEFTVDASALDKLRAAGVNLDTSKFKAAGGPVDGGSKYTVNELGKEAFLGASGRLSMINAKSWGTWRAPEDGVVIPAHLTKKLDIPSSGVNLNNPRSAAVGRRVSSVDRSLNSRAHQMLNTMHSTQRLQAQQLGKLTAAITTMAGKDWSVDVNINGNNPLLNKLRRH